MPVFSVPYAATFLYSGCMGQIKSKLCTNHNLKHHFTTLMFECQRCGTVLCHESLDRVAHCFPNCESNRNIKEEVVYYELWYN